jgi:nucleoside recognition membrane protein YjiH
MNNTLSEVFLTFLITSVIGCFLAVVRQAYKSKCSQVEICCIKIVRDTVNEEKIDEMELQKGEAKV